eukprot:1157597-Pelagomonas_calceolata.AAC.2
MSPWPAWAFAREHRCMTRGQASGGQCTMRPHVHAACLLGRHHVNIQFDLSLDTGAMVSPAHLCTLRSVLAFRRGCSYIESGWYIFRFKCMTGREVVSWSYPQQNTRARES